MWLHFTASYKHLGVMFTASTQLDAEVRHRIGNAESAFQLLARPLLRNRHLPAHIRLRLFDTLVGTRLWYGIGAWETPTKRQLKQLESAQVSMLKRVHRMGPAAKITNTGLLAESRMGSARSKLANERLLYARQVFRHAPQFVQHMLQRGDMLTTDSWLHGLRCDLQWLCEIDADCPKRWATDTTDFFEFLQLPGSDWVREVKKAWRLHVRQEAMMSKMHDFHNQIFSAMRHGDGELEGVIDLTEDCTYPCFCGRQFSTPQGLALHKSKRHDIHSPEHQFICGPVCPNCLTYFWSSQRAQQHLSYTPKDETPNKCFAALMTKGYTTEFAAHPHPRSLQGVIRLDAIPCEGPTYAGGTDQQKEATRLEELLRDLQPRLAVELPRDADGTTEAVHRQLAQSVQDWLADFYQIWGLMFMHLWNLQTDGLPF